MRVFLDLETKNFEFLTSENFWGPSPENFWGPGPKKFIKKICQKMDSTSTTS